MRQIERTYQIEKQALRVQQYSVVSSGNCSCNLPCSLQANDGFAPCSKLSCRCSSTTELHFCNTCGHPHGLKKKMYLNLPESKESRILLDCLTNEACTLSLQTQYNLGVMAHMHTL